VKLINERMLIREVAARWRAQYGHGNYANDAEKQGKQKSLDAIDPETASADDIASIIGNRSWTDVPKCDECNRATLAVVEVGEPPDYESATARLCAECARAAAMMFA
jgi:hypothetical protein